MVPSSWSPYTSGPTTASLKRKAFSRRLNSLSPCYAPRPPSWVEISIVKRTGTTPHCTTRCAARHFFKSFTWHTPRAPSPTGLWSMGCSDAQALITSSPHQTSPPSTPPSFPLTAPTWAWSPPSTPMIQTHNRSTGSASNGAYWHQPTPHSSRA